MEASAKAIVRNLVDTLNTPYHGSSSMTPSIYDTAWVSMVYKPDGLSRCWLFPQCFESVLAAQGPNGSFGTSNTQIDAILNTAAALLALCKHKYTATPKKDSPGYNLTARIEKAAAFLQLILEEWDIESTVHVGYEILVPSLLSMLSDEGLRFDFPGSRSLMAEAERRMSGFSPEALYSQQRTTLVHSLEALIGHIDFNKVSHHIHNGAMMASPASTAAYLIHSGTWNEEAEGYLRFVVDHRARKVPSAFPISVFEIAWVLSTLLDHGFSREDLGNDNVSKLADFLEKELHNQSGTVGFAPGLLPDADDTARAVLTMNLLNRPTSCSRLIEVFGGSPCFKTYVHESAPSFSTNCNVVIALARSPTPSEHGPEILKALRFLIQLWEEGEVKDKWNVEQQYSFMLLARAIHDVLKLHDNHELAQVCEDPIVIRLVTITMQLCVRTISSQNEDGAWGGSCEVSAYAVLTLKTLASLPWIRDIIGDQVNRSISLGANFLTAQDTHWKNPGTIWVEKVSFGSEVLSETYCLAALRAPATYVWGTTVVTLGETPMNKVNKFSTFFSRIPLFSEEPLWRLRASVAEGYVMADTLNDSRVRSVFPSAKSATSLKYVEYIPLTWTLSNNANGFGISIRAMREMMIISLLNFQADKYLEDILADRDLNYDFAALHRVIRHLLPHYPFEQSSAQQPDHGQLLSPSPNDSHINTTYCHRASDSATPILLENFSKTIKRFISYVQDHSAVSQSSLSCRRSMTARLLNFLHAHIIQGEDNRYLYQGDTPHEKSPIFRGARTSFYDWVHTTSADHTSCPYSFQFFQCLITPAGLSCFQSLLATYISEDLCRHLASLCRIYNDYGSIVRDRKECNLNSVNFPEFHILGGSYHEREGSRTPDMTDDTLRKKLMQVAAYERNCLDAALQRLKPETNMKTWKAVQVFVKVTDLYGQIYVMRDINNV